MNKTNKAWAGLLANIAANRPWLVILIVSLISIVMLGLASHLEMRLNFKDLLPEKHPVVKSYREVQARFGEPNIVIVLEGERGSMVEMAEVLVPELEKLESLYNIQVKLPEEYIRDHGFLMMKSRLFKRSLDIYSDRTLVGSFKGLNDDYEKEYTESESNLKRDETEIARGLLGLTRSLEVLSANLAGRKNAPSIDEAVDAFTLGEPWYLSLDRKMLLISCVPVADIAEDFNGILITVDEVQKLVDVLNPVYPDVQANLTGMGKIGEDEMHSVGFYTQLLSLAALIFIYILLSRTFKSWSLPAIALIPLVVGIIWTLGLLYLLFGSLNLFTAMIMLILLGLGIDFSIHLIARFGEEMNNGREVREALEITLSDTGTGVITGGLTTSIAFFTLMIAQMKGIFEFGVASGSGVILTLLTIFLTLPSLLVLHERRRAKRIAKKVQEVGNKAAKEKAGWSGTQSYDWIGNVALAGWKKPGIFIPVALLIIAASAWAMFQIKFEYDFLELEAEGLKSVELQREVPKRFGLSDHSAWLITESVEQSRELKEKLRKKGTVGEVVAISDFIPSENRVLEYTPHLKKLRQDILHQTLPGWQDGDTDRLADELDRLWDNLDLMSNLAYTAGLDRIVKVIDQMTGYDSETNTTDTTAILPGLATMLRKGVDNYRAEDVAEKWGEKLTTNVYSMADPSPVGIEDLPDVIKKSHLPREGEGYLLHIFPRKYLYDKKELTRFAEQTESVHPDVSGTERLFLLMMDKTLEEGGRAAWLALAVIAVLLLLHFRGLSGLLAMIPLVTGALAMLGLMYLIGMKYNYMNLIALPIILGIGIDDGVHALHRFKTQVNDTGTERVYESFRFVGRAILLTSLTTMIGFGSVAFYEMRGMASFGQVLFMGVGACFVTSVFVLPAVLRLFYGRNKTSEAQNETD